MCTTPAMSFRSLSIGGRRGPSPPSRTRVAAEVAGHSLPLLLNGGVDTEDDYPYNGHEAKCKLAQEKCKRLFLSMGLKMSQLALLEAVANQPVSVAIETGSREFQLYQSGVFTGRCGTDLDHGAVIVGYGTDHGKDYWIVRNSWGEAGYIRMERNVNTSAGKCGIAMLPSYPIKKDPKHGPCHPSSVNPPTLLPAAKIITAAAPQTTPFAMFRREPVKCFCFGSSISGFLAEDMEAGIVFP
ncbi:hypothetical protein OPV22_007810 [Ensete ventricosum]|uniref:Peptidase C1A papain C-terminal domain-containing protein n=1 Tax=Ensete ventricosum TaxID=4639 RepID=A0AAV8R1I1_ENSVE|nr:hypothetical protein OPV22_007810 [Ensete ventricosum]